MLLFVAVDDPRTLQTAQGVCARSVLAALQACEETELVVIPGMTHRGLRRRVAQAGGLVGGKTTLEGTVNLDDVVRGVRAAIERTKARAVIFNHMRAAAAIARWEGPQPVPFVYMSQNREAVAAESLIELAGGFQSFVLRQDARRLRALEDEVLLRCDHSVALTEEDARRFEEICAPERVATLPPPLEEGSMPVVEGSGFPNRVSLISSFLWAPKRWNGQWLAREVMPQVWESSPEAELHLVGARADKIGVDGPRIKVWSDVPDVRPHYGDAGVLLVPERQRSGLKFKTIQSGFAGRAIVSTGGGLEGTGLVDGRSALVAESAREFAEAIVRLLKDDDLRRDLGTAARAAVTAHFDPAALTARYRAFVGSL